MKQKGQGMKEKKKSTLARGKESYNSIGKCNKKKWWHQYIEKAIDAKDSKAAIAKGATAVATAKEAAEMEKNAPAAVKNAVNDAANKALKGLDL